MIRCDCADDATRLEHRTLLTLLAINGVMFLAEAVVGWVAESGRSRGGLGRRVGEKGGTAEGKKQISKV